MPVGDIARIEVEHFQELQDMIINNFDAQFQQTLQ